MARVLGREALFFLCQLLDLTLQRLVVDEFVILVEASSRYDEAGRVGGVEGCHRWEGLDCHFRIDFKLHLRDESSLFPKPDDDSAVGLTGLDEGIVSIELILFRRLKR